MQAAEYDRGSDDELASGCAVFAGCRPLRLVHVFEDALACDDVVASRVRQCELSGRPAQQPRLDMRFQFGDFAADGGQRHAKPSPRGGQASRLNRNQNTVIDSNRSISILPNNGMMYPNNTA